MYTYTYIHRYVYKEFYFKELAHMIMEAGKPTLCRVGLKAGGPGELTTP